MRILLGFSLLLPLLSQGQTSTFNHTGAPQAYVVPTGVTVVQVVATGATRGATVRATLTVTPNETLTIMVGGANGYNGGGAKDGTNSQAGGGATDLRCTGASTGDYLSTRNALLVAGGGGGGGYRVTYSFGGVGGTPNGGVGGTALGGSGGGGATQTGAGAASSSGGTSGSSNSGGNGSQGGGGGGGGYYGGAGGGNGNGGGGGSTWVMPTGSSSISYASSSSSDGQLTITPLVTATPALTAPTSGSTVSSTTPTYTGTAPAGSTVRLYVDGTLLSPTATASSGGTFSLTQPTALGAGSHQVYATAQTSGSSVSASSLTNSFTVLTPTISSFAASTGPVGTSVTITGANLSSPTTVAVNGTAGTVTASAAGSARFTVGAGSSSGALTLVTAYGGAVSTLTPVLRLQATGGTNDKTAYLDQVELLDGAGTVVSGGISNGSFETGAPAGDLTAPGTAVTSWTFGGNARLSTTASPFAPPAPPDGSSHLALLQMTGGYLEQSLSLAVGTYQLRLQLAHRQYGGLPYDQGVQVMLNGVALGMALTTTSASYVQLVSLPFSVSAAGTFTVIPPPTVTALSAGAELPGQAVTLTGTGFTAGSTVTFGGVAAGSVTYTSATSLTATVPLGASVGSSAIVVTAAGGSSTSAPAFTVLGVFSGTSTSCASTVPYLATGDGAWHYLTTASGQVVAALQDTRAALGSVTVSYQATSSAGAVRQDGWGRRYLDRNFHFSASGGAFPGSTVNVRLYGLTSEFARLQAATTGTSYATLTATQYSGGSEDCELSNDNFTTGEFRTLPATASTPGGGVSWFVAQLAVADHFSEFYLTPSPTPLPVELLSFTAERVGEAVQLAWRTASEKNSARFEVERSADGQSFTTMGTVPAAGSTASPTEYSYLDDKLTTSPPPHLTYYRLQQVDLDGTFSYSPVRTVQLTTSPPHHFTIFPNPAHRLTTLVGAAPYAAVTVLDALGRARLTARAEADGTARLVLPADLPAGVYLVRSGPQLARLLVE